MFSDQTVRLDPESDLLRKDFKKAASYTEAAFSYGIKQEIDEHYAGRLISATFVSPEM